MLLSSHHNTLSRKLSHRCQLPIGAAGCRPTETEVSVSQCLHQCGSLNHGFVCHSPGDSRSRMTSLPAHVPPTSSRALAMVLKYWPGAPFGHDMDKTFIPPHLRMGRNQESTNDGSSSSFHPWWNAREQCAPLHTRHVHLLCHKPMNAGRGPQYSCMHCNSCALRARALRETWKVSQAVLSPVKEISRNATLLEWLLFCYGFAQR